MTEIKDPKIYILYENAEWLEPLVASLDKLLLPYQAMPVIEGGVDLDKPPNPGLYFNRLSASAHTRGHSGSVSLGGAILAWLNLHDMRVINGRSVLDLEVRKFDQYAALKKAGVKVPKTIATTGRTALLEAASSFKSSFIVKPNRGGKGLGVRLFESSQELEKALENGEEDFVSQDGIQLVQNYIKPSSPHVIRSEFIGGELYYSVKVDTSAGFELCPADAEYCAIASQDDKEKFKILEDYEHPLKKQYEEFLKTYGIEVAAIESIEDQNGDIFTYDINTNTNYNQKAEGQAKEQYSAYDQLAEYLGKTLKDAL